jgi:hypothetical protein
VQNKKIYGKRKSRKNREEKKRRKRIDTWKLEALMTGSEGSAGQSAVLMSIGDERR